MLLFYDSTNKGELCMKHVIKQYENSYLSYFLMYFFFFFCVALFSGFISVYLMDMGFRASQVSFVVSCSFILSMLVQPFIGKLNDKYEPKYVNSLLLATTIILALIFVRIRNLYLIAIIYSIVLSIINGTRPIIERMAVLSKYKYGSIRVWATIGYALATMISGYLYAYIAPWSLYIVFGIGEILCVIGILGTKNTVVETKENVSFKEKVSIRKIILNKNMILYLIITCIFYGVTNVHHIYLPTMLRDNGLQINMVSTVIFISTLSEVPVILLSRFYMNRFSNKQLLLVVFGLLIIEFGTFAFISSLTIQILVVFLTKTVATMSFIMINLKVIATIVDISLQNTGLSIVSTCKSFISIIFQMMAGYVIDYTTFQIFYTILLIFSIIGFIIILSYKIPNNNTLQIFH